MPGGLCERTRTVAQQHSHAPAHLIADQQIRFAVVVEIARRNTRRAPSRRECAAPSKSAGAVAQEHAYVVVEVTGKCHVHFAVAVEIAHRDPVRLDTRRQSRIGERKSARSIAQQHSQVAGIHCVGDNQIELTVAIEITHCDCDRKTVAVHNRDYFGESKPARAVTEQYGYIRFEIILVNQSHVHFAVAVEVAHRHTDRGKHGKRGRNGTFESASAGRRCHNLVKNG